MSKADWIRRGVEDTIRKEKESGRKVEEKVFGEYAVSPVWEDQRN